MQEFHTGHKSFAAVCFRFGFKTLAGIAVLKATTELASWLESDYRLTASEIAVVLGTSIEYNLAEVADRNVGVVAKVWKEALAPLGISQ